MAVLAHYKRRACRGLRSDDELPVEKCPWRLSVGRRPSHATVENAERTEQPVHSAVGTA